ncbi:MAG: AAA family ATPase [Saprospiraceae bacterium]|nr:AAA family ATPase [Saprospiraceae bacterium]
MSYKSIYVAATSQHVGKTTSTLGLASAFRNKGINVGYCKPVGQRYVQHNGLNVDKDVVLFADLLNFEVNPDLHSPVILGSGATAEFLEQPENYNYERDILFAAGELDKRHELVIFEGTGHPGVGSVVEMSNPDVAHLTKSGLIMVAEGGIGNTIDNLSMCLEKFNRLEVPVIGVILNKVLEDKREKVAYYVKKWLDKHHLPFLGTMPFDKSMGLPLMQSIAESVKGKVEMNAERLNNKVEGMIAGSLISHDELRGKENNMLLIVGATRLDLAIDDTLHIMEANGWSHAPFSGIIATGYGEYSMSTIDFIKKHNIPLIRTMLETYAAVLKISRIEVKINLQTPWKIQRAVEMIEQNINLDYILEKSRY